MGFFELLRTANHNLFRNKVRTGLTILAIFVGSFTIILNVAIHSGVSAFIDEQTNSLGGEDFIMILPTGMESMMQGMMSSTAPQEFSENEATLQTLTAEDIAALKAIDGINPDDFFSPMPFTGTGYYASTRTDKRYKVQALSAVPPGNFVIALSAGTLPDDSGDELQITLQAGFPTALGYANDEDILGETITVAIQDPFTKQFIEYHPRVVGVLATSIVTMNDGSFISRAFYDRISAVTAKYYPEDYEAPVYYVTTTFDASRYTEAEIKAKLKDAGYLAFTMSDVMGMIRSFFDVIMVVFTIFGAIALLAAAIGIVNTLLMSVEERTREIGLDKALGMSSGRIFLSFSTEAILLGFWGSVFGIAIAMLIGTIANAAVHAPGAFLEVFPTFQLFRFTLGNVLPIVLIVMIIAFVAGTAPAWKAAHKNPIDALRYE